MVSIQKAINLEKAAYFCLQDVVLGIPFMKSFRGNINSKFQFI